MHVLFFEALTLSKTKSVNREFPIRDTDKHPLSGLWIPRCRQIRRNGPANAQSAQLLGLSTFNNKCVVETNEL